MIELVDIQNNLNAPKNQWNKFGKYNYRSCEDILSGLKEHLIKHNCYVTLSDEITIVSDRIYVKSTATIYNGKSSVSVSAFAREPKEQKGMNEAQITGSASSYARKYALNGLFMIDDTKDADSQDSINLEDSQPDAQHQNSNQEIEWLSEENYNITLDCRSIRKIRATIQAYSTPTKKMKKIYKDKLLEKIKQLPELMPNGDV